MLSCQGIGCVASLVVCALLLQGCSGTSPSTAEQRHEKMFRAVVFYPDEIPDSIEDGQDVNAIWSSTYHYGSGDQEGTVDIEQTYLSVAVRHGKTESVVMLLAHSADPNLGASTVGYTPLTWAIRANDVEIVTALLDAGADPNLRFPTPYSEGEYPVIWAARKDSPEILALLLKHGADASVKDQNGQTCRDIAETWKRQEILNVLAQHATSTPAPSNKVQ